MGGIVGPALDVIVVSLSSLSARLNHHKSKLLKYSAYDILGYLVSIMAFATTRTHIWHLVYARLSVNTMNCERAKDVVGISRDALSTIFVEQ